jgi:hypothetical protein
MMSILPILRDCGTALAAFGLLSNIVGTILIYRFGAPPLRVTPNGGELDVWVATQTGESKAKNERRYRQHLFWSRAGVILVALGFLCQFLALFVVDNG